MVNATVDNEAISISLQGGESTTVPTGEVWKVTITCAVEGEGGSGSNDGALVKINGNVVLAHNHYDQKTDSAVTAETVVTGDDTISVVASGVDTSSSEAGSHIGGFVVN